MFLKFIKNFGLKKNIKKCLAQYKPGAASGVVNTIGVLADETYFTNKDNFINEIAKYGIKKENVSILVYKKRILGKEAKTANYSYYTRKNITAGGSIKKEEAINFLDTPFDLLISYYDTEKLPLMLATLQSQAKFKAGFASVDKRLNSFTISMEADKYKEFIAELFKYLKILNKL